MKSLISRTRRFQLHNYFGTLHFNFFISNISIQQTFLYSNFYSLIMMRSNVNVVLLCARGVRQIFSDESAEKICWTTRAHFNVITFLSL